MRALWSDRPTCSHNVSQKVKHIRRFSDFKNPLEALVLLGVARGLLQGRPLQLPMACGVGEELTKSWPTFV